jgi:hypothetical protein
MIEISWKDGPLKVTNYEPIEDYDEFEIIIGEHDIPFFKYGKSKTFEYEFFFKYYIEYNIRVYGINKKKNDLELICSKKFDCENENILVQLEPKTQSDLDIWTTYLENFVEKKKCKLYINLIEKFGNFELNDSSFYKNVNIDYNQNYYSQYAIRWIEDPTLNPKGIQNISPYELINNFFLKL